MLTFRSGVGPAGQAANINGTTVTINDGAALVFDTGSSQLQDGSTCSMLGEGQLIVNSAALTVTVPALKNVRQNGGSISFNGTVDITGHYDYFNGS